MMEFDSFTDKVTFSYPLNQNCTYYNRFYNLSFYIALSLLLSHFVIHFLLLLFSSEISIILFYSIFSLLVVDNTVMSTSAGLNCNDLHFLWGPQDGMYTTDLTMTQLLPLVEHL